MDTGQPKPRFSYEELTALLAVGDNEPSTETIQRGLTSGEWKDLWHVSKEAAMTIIQEEVKAGILKCVYEQRMTLTGHTAGRPVYTIVEPKV